jgi:hypothetical protein
MEESLEVEEVDSDDGDDSIESNSAGIWLLKAIYSIPSIAITATLLLQDELDDSNDSVRIGGSVPCKSANKKFQGLTNFLMKLIFA